MIMTMLMVVMIINSMVNTDVLSCLQLCLALQVGCYCQDLCNSQQMGPLPTDFGFLRLQPNIVHVNKYKMSSIIFHACRNSQTHISLPFQR